MDSENHAIVYFDKFDLHVFSTIWNLNQSLAKKVNAITGFISSRFVLLCPARREGGSMLCFCPSVCPSRTQRITREPEGLACPNSEWRFPTLDETRVPVSSLKGQRSGLPGPLMLRHILRHIFRMRTYRIPLVVVVGGNVLSISRPFPYQFAPNSYSKVF